MFMVTIQKADRIAMGIYSVLFLGGGVLLRGMGMGFYWMAIMIGVILGAVVMIAHLSDKYFNRR